MPNYAASQRENIEDEMRAAGKVEEEVKHRFDHHLPSSSFSTRYMIELNYRDDEDGQDRIEEEGSSRFPTLGRDWHEARSKAETAASGFLSSFRGERSLIQVAFTAIRTNLIPGLILQSFALFILILYFSSPAVESAFNSIATFKDQYGLPFSCITTCIAGGFIPFLFVAFLHTRYTRTLLALNLPIPPRVPSLAFEGLFLCALWAEKGIEADLFYQLQALMFGDGISAGTIIPKVIVDQFVYNPVWGTPTCLVAFFWKNSGFDWRFAYNKWKSREYWTYILPSTLISVWLVWVPAASIIYALPGSLQIPLMDVVVCFWSIMLQLLSKSARNEGGESEGGDLNGQEEADQGGYGPAEVALSEVVVQPTFMTS